jgi:hypothetical protein
LRKFVLIVAVCALFLGASFAWGQQTDILVGGGTLLSSSPYTASQNQPVVGEKGGPYPSAGFDMLLHRRYGFNVEGAWKYKQGSYPGFGETYRPILYDVNALFQPRLGKKAGLDLMVGAGGESVVFYQGYSYGCPYASCSNFLSSTHFLEHLGGGVRYYFWHRWPRVFVRPEVHYYHIQNNREFNSNNVVRAGGSLGFTFGGK